MLRHFIQKVAGKNFFFKPRIMVCIPSGVTTVEKRGREPSAAQLQQTISIAKQKRVKVLFVQKEFTNRNTEIVEEGTNAKKVEINPLSYNWNKEMEHL